MIRRKSPHESIVIEMHMCRILLMWQIQSNTYTAILQLLFHKLPFFSFRLCPESRLKAHHGHGGQDIHLAIVQPSGFLDLSSHWGLTFLQLHVVQKHLSFQTTWV